MRGQPSDLALKRARELGVQLAAKCDRQLLSAVASRHKIYTSFQFEYRYSVEQTPVFQPIEQELQTLAEREARKSRFQLEESRYWDALDSCMLCPLKDALWTSCEQRLHLRDLFSDRLHRPQSAADSAKPETDLDADSLRVLEDLSKWV